VSEQPRGCTGERCKAAGTYCSQAGGKQYFSEGEVFGPCPVTGEETQWQRVT